MTRKERVTRVIDGDTFETASRKHPVHLAGVDARDKGQMGYAAARNAPSRLIDGKTAEIDTRARDSYGRSVAKVKVGGKSVNRGMKKHGR